MVGKISFFKDLILGGKKLCPKSSECKILEEFVTKPISKLEPSILPETSSKITKHFSSVDYLKPKVLKSFLCEEEAFQYGKTIAVRALQGAKPHEHLIVQDGKNIINESIGTSNEAGLNLIELVRLPKTSKVLHGHPERTPISFTDYEFLTKYNANEVIAFNKQGEFSSLRKCDGFSEKNIDSLIEYKKKYFIDVLGVDATKIDNTEYVVNYLNQNYANQTTDDGIKKINEFWKKYSNELGIQYQTNYSYLT